MLPNSTNKRMVACVCSASLPVLQWHTTQSRELRSSMATERWIIDQLEGSLMLHIENVLQSIGDANKLASCDFITSAFQADRADPAEAVVEDEIAQLFAHYSLGLAFCRMRRTLHMTCGWPVQLYKVNSSRADLVEEMFDRFQRDRVLFEQAVVRSGR